MYTSRERVRTSPRRSINVSRGVISFSNDSCVKYQIKHAKCLFKWSFVVTDVRGGESGGGGDDGDGDGGGGVPGVAGGGRPGWIFDATCGGKR